MDTLIHITSCDTCGGNNLVEEMHVNNWQLKRCDDCGLVFTSPRYSETQLKQIYAANYYERTKAYFESIVRNPTVDDRRLARHAAGLVSNSKRRSLDVGCGAGRLVSAFREFGFDASGIEPSRIAVEVGRRAGRKIDTVELDAIAEESFDCITVMHVLEHVPSPKEFLRHCWRILSKNGLLVVEVPNYGCKRSRQLRDKWKHLYPDTHLYQFTVASLTHAVLEGKFQIIKTVLVGGAAGWEARHECETVPAPSGSNSRPSLIVRFKQFIWSHRSVFFAIPYAKEILQYVVWDLLERGEYVRLFARKN